MAYRHFPGAPFLFCWSEGDCVCVKELSGRVNKYECKLGIKTKPAIIPFQGPDAIWCIRDAGVLYVGRNDCTFSPLRCLGLPVQTTLPYCGAVGWIFCRG